MKVIYLHQYFNTPDMSGGTRSYEMGRRLVKAGHEVHIITSDRENSTKGNDWNQVEIEGMTVHWLPVKYSNKMNYKERIRAFFKYAWKAGAKATKIGGDVVFATSTPLTIAIPAIYAKKKLKIPMVFEVRDLWPELPIAVGALKNPIFISAAKYLEMYVYRHAKRIVTLSPGMKEGIMKKGYPEDKITVIPNSSDIDLFQVDPVKADEFTRKYNWLGNRSLVIYTGTLGMINGVDYLVHLADETQKIDQEICFLVIGSGSEEEKVRQLAKELQVLDNNFFMLSDLPKREIPYWLSRAKIATSVFIDLKAMWANSANKFFDALAAGKPIAINYGGWQAKLLQETGAGLVLNPKDIKGSARLLVERIRNEDWINSAGEAAFGLARDRFDRDILAKQLEKVLFETYNEK